MKQGQRVGFKWPIEPDTEWTDEAIAGLVGQVASFSLLGGDRVPAKVTKARRVEGSPERPAIYIEIEGVEGVEVDLRAISFDLDEGHG